MLTATTITILALLAVSALVWFGMRRTRVIQQVSDHLSGPVEQMKEQLLLTADSAIYRLDGKMAQMEILLSELDRRSNLLAQQSQRQQVLQNQLEQQQQQLTAWFGQQRRQLEQEITAALQVQEKNRMLQLQTMPATESQRVAFPGTPDNPNPVVSSVASPALLKQIATEKAVEEPTLLRPQKVVRVLQAKEQPVTDKRTLILEMSEQGMSVEDIAKKMGVGKGEVMLLLKLRRKVNP